MDLYNLFVSGEKIYNQIKKSPKDLTYEDYLLMMDPFFISENDIVEVERNNLKGGSEDEFGDDMSSFVESLQTEEGGEGGEGGEAGSGFLSKLNPFKSAKMSEKDIQDEEATPDISLEEQEVKEEMKKDKKNALQNFKKGMSSFLKYFIILLFIGGGPLFIWFVIMYYTFKRMKSAYKWMIEPM